MLVVFGLGNPGTKYEGTRHNAGVETLLKMAAYYQVSLKRRCFSSFSSATIGDEVKLVFPLTYMNESGKVVPNCSCCCQKTNGEATVPIKPDEQTQAWIMPRCSQVSELQSVTNISQHTLKLHKFSRKKICRVCLRKIQGK